MAIALLFGLFFLLLLLGVPVAYALVDDLEAVLGRLRPGARSRDADGTGPDAAEPPRPGLA